MVEKKSLNVKLSTITDFPTQKLINIIYQSPTEMPAPINRGFMQRSRIFIVIVLPLLTLWDSVRFRLCINRTRSCLGLDVVADDIRPTRSRRKCCSDGVFRLSGLLPLQESLVEQRWISELPALEMPFGGGQFWVHHSSELPALFILFVCVDMTFNWFQMLFRVFCIVSTSFIRFTREVLGSRGLDCGQRLMLWWWTNGRVIAFVR